MRIGRKIKGAIIFGLLGMVITLFVQMAQNVLVLPRLGLREWYIIVWVTLTSSIIGYLIASMPLLWGHKPEWDDDGPPGGGREHPQDETIVRRIDKPTEIKEIKRLKAA